MCLLALLQKETVGVDNIQRIVQETKSSVCMQRRSQIISKSAKGKVGVSEQRKWGMASENAFP